MEELAQSVRNAKMPGQVDSDVASERRGGCVQLWGLASLPVAIFINSGTSSRNALK